MIGKFYSLLKALVGFVKKLFQPKRPAIGEGDRKGGIVVLSIDDQGFKMVRHLVHNGVVLVLVPAGMLDDEFLQKLLAYFSGMG